MRKSPHHFECRDDLWARVEALAAHRGVSSDDVVQAALLQLFLKRRKDSGVHPLVAPTLAPPTSVPSQASHLPTPSAASASLSSGARPIPAPGVSGFHPSNTSAPGQKALFAGGLAARLAGRALTPRPGVNRIEPGDSGILGPTNPFDIPDVNRVSDQVPLLYLFCEGSWYLVDKEEFVIGRGRKYCDLTIKDANISRRHCAIGRRNGEYFMRDLGSTNGIEYDGVRVDDHRIVEGTTYQLCNHDLTFTYNRPNEPILSAQSSDDGE